MVDLAPYKDWIVEEDKPEQSDWKTQLIHGSSSNYIQLSA